ncbi:MAG TPA: hypothetical protein VHT53_06110 [Candidatus Elarobacter sp.]|jgi:hypothetical protein|nr:hypothetical protein [Candidatus Elarobacter sp.]
MRYDLTTVEGGRSYFITSKHVDAILAAKKNGEPFVRFAVNNESSVDRPLDLILNVDHIAVIVGTRDGATNENTGGIAPELLAWYVDEVQELRIGSMIVSGRIAATGREGEYVVENEDGYAFLVEPERVRFMRRRSDENAAPRYVRGDETPPIALSTPESAEPIVEYNAKKDRCAIVEGAATHVLAFMRGVGHAVVRGGGSVLVIASRTPETFRPLGILVSRQGEMLTDLDAFDLVVAYDVKDETAVALAAKCKRLLVACTTNGRRGGAGMPGFRAACEPAVYRVSDDEPRLETA